MLIALARFGSPAKVGQFSLALAITAPIILFTNLKLRAVQATDVRGEYAFSDYLGLRLFSLPIALAAIASVIFISGYRSATMLVVVIIALAKSVEATSDVIFGLLQAHERMNRIAISMISKGVLSLIGFGGALWITKSLVWAAAALLIAWTFVFIAYDCPTAIQLLRHDDSVISYRSRFLAVASLHPRWNWRVLRRLAWTALPLGITVMLGALSDSLPRYFLTRYLGESDLGIFAGMAYVLVASSIVINALGQSASPRLASVYVDGDIRRFLGILAILIGLAIVVGLGGILVVIVAGRQILGTLYGDAYTSHVDTFTWIMVDAAIGYAYVFLGTAVNSMRQFRVQLPIHVGTIVVLVTGLLLMVPKFGMNGAAWAMIASGCFEAMAYGCVMVRAIQKVLEQSRSGPQKSILRQRNEV